ncbi:MAG: hypothetical protein H0X14_05680, partial [Acidobacteria bacterium]|nr:hypothetical protein [Acidobacteriota bacterium]
NGTSPTGEPEEQVHARHILIASGEVPQGENPGAPPTSMRDKAKAAVEQEKEEKIIEEIVNRSRVTVADNFTATAPQMPQLQTMPPGMMPPDERGAQPPAEGSGRSPAAPQGNTGGATRQPNAPAPSTGGGRPRTP